LLLIRHDHFTVGEDSLVHSSGREPETDVLPHRLTECGGDTHLRQAQHQLQGGPPGHHGWAETDHRPHGRNMMIALN
jgi:hypothetical protein